MKELGMIKKELEVGDVVQIDPTLKECFFRGCFMTVTELKPWGAQGYIQMISTREKMGGQAYFRATWEQMEFIGKTAWIKADDE